MNESISNLERKFDDEELIEVRKRSYDECGSEGFMRNGIPFITDLMRIYRDNLRQKYEDDLK